jgi:hypothetical protein
MIEQRARGTRTVVVAAVTEKGLVRGIAHFTSISDVVDEVKRAVGVLSEVTEWSSYEYWTPSYFDCLVEGGFSAWDVPSGIFLFPWTDQTTDWRDPTKRFTTTGTLLWRPRGWTAGRLAHGVEVEQ